jgi:hypothetical protein
MKLTRRIQTQEIGVDLFNYFLMFVGRLLIPCMMRLNELDLRLDFSLEFNDYIESRSVSVLIRKTGSKLAVNFFFSSSR